MQQCMYMDTSLSAQAHVSPVSDRLMQADIERIFATFGKIADIEFKRGTNVHSAVVTYASR